MDLYTVRDAIQDTLDSITGLNCYWYHPDRPSAPFVLVKPESCDLRDIQADNDACTATFTLVICVNGTVDSTGQKLLDAYLSTEGTSSISAKLLSSPTLGQSGISATPVSWQNYGRVTLEDGTVWFGAEMTVEVYA